MRYRNGLKNKLAAALLCIVSVHTSAQELGRLFTTPAQRAALEQGRQSGKAPLAPADGSILPAPGTPEESGAAAAAANRAPLPGERVIVVNGFVRRSGSGRVTTWIDSVPRNVNENLGSGASLTRAGNGGGVEVRLGSGQSVTLKPGQAVDAANGRVKESYQPERR